MKAIIAGGGVGGLALALMLQRRGVEAEVYEQAAEIREVGVGINVLPHAIKELAALGLLPALDAIAIRTKELHYVNRLGQKVWSELRGRTRVSTTRSSPFIAGRLQKVILDAVIAEMGPRAVNTGLRLRASCKTKAGSSRNSPMPATVSPVRQCAATC